MQVMRFVRIALALFVIGHIASLAAASMFEVKESVLDFSKPEEAKAKATWTTPDVFSYGAQGMTLPGDARTSRDLTIETTQPIAVGWQWRPVRGVFIMATIEPPEAFLVRPGSDVYPAGQFYARYSPDAKHWSSWQNLEMRPKDREHPTQVYHGELRVPYKEQAAYNKLICKYARLDVPWQSDEEAALKWILKTNPAFLEKNLPFVGYVQFLFETQLHGGQNLHRIVVRLTYSAGGMHQPPKDESIWRNAGGPWRFRAE
jgi:hypothetical protein